MNYIDPFWYSFLQDFQDDEQTRSEQQSKRRLAEVLEQHRKEYKADLVIEGDLYSH